MATASIAYQWAEDEMISVEVECEDNRPDMLDDISNRASDLLLKAIAAVNAAAQAKDAA